MFEQHYKLWMDEQKIGRNGEALRKLVEDHGYSEKLFLQEVWWPLFRSFNGLHAEYEVPNGRNGSYYLDFAYIRHPYKIDWEIDDFGSHAKNMTRREFEYERDRQNQLVHDGWLVFRFSLDAVKERPHRCRQTILQIIGKLYGGVREDLAGLSLKKKEILRLALYTRNPITPSEVRQRLGVCVQHARKLMHELVKDELLQAHSGKIRVRAYSLGPKAPPWI
ncbi:DNA-binding response regulator [Cohnella hongkongensis]|uniref:DNA-binding response regulator n=1 Tax=Cohnella hongkongensis TaxID=178337 RepID=A0ABV9F9C3_9BACL